MSSSSPSSKDDELDRLGSELNICLMKQYSFTIAGVGLGIGYGIHRRSLLPLVGFGALGSIGDLIYGLGYACKPVFDAYKKCRDRDGPSKKPPLPPLPPRERAFK